MIDLLTSAFENYVNKLSIWTAYCIFLLSVGVFRNTSGTPDKKIDS